MKIRAFITHKKAESYIDCQDRFQINTLNRSLAVSDGMSQSIFQSIWAKILVDNYTENKWEPKSPQEDDFIVNQLSKEWNSKIIDIINNQRNSGKNRAADRNERSLIEGKSAGATFAGIKFTKGATKCSGVVLGDSCIIAIDPKNYSLKEIYTSQDRSNFDNYPDHYDSNPTYKGKGYIKSYEGEVSNEYSILIVSDPLSDLLYTKQKEGNEKELIRQILELKSHNDFIKLVDNWRDIHKMHNDDTTLIIIEDDGSEEFNIIHNDNIDNLIKGKDDNVTSNIILDSIDMSKKEDEITKELKEILKMVIKKYPTIINPSIKRIIYHYLNSIIQYIQKKYNLIPKNNGRSKHT